MSNVKFHFDPITPAASICWYWQGWSYAKLQAAVWHTSCVHLVLVAELAVIIIVWSRRANYSHFSTLSPFKAYYYYYGNIKWDWSCRFFSCLLTNVRKIEIKYEENFNPNQPCTSHTTKPEKKTHVTVVFFIWFSYQCLVPSAALRDVLGVLQHPRRSNWGSTIGGSEKL